MEDKLLYESKGTPVKHIARILICTVIFIIGAVFFFYLSGAKYAGLRIDGVQMRDTYMYSEDNRSKLRIIGFILLLLAAFSLDVVIGMKQCWVKLYRDHMEAHPLSLGLKKRVVQVYYHQINSVQMNGYTIDVFTAGGKKIRLLCLDTQQAFEIIHRMIL